MVLFQALEDITCSALNAVPAIECSILYKLAHTIVRCSKHPDTLGFLQENTDFAPRRRAYAVMVNVENLQKCQAFRNGS